MPTFTVIMATYNRGRHIAPSIRSVLAQTLQDFEFLVIGDCCDDDTQEVVEGFGADGVLWHNIPERCGSQSFPNNAGIGMARGRYIAYLGHDDVWAPDHLATVAGLIGRNPDLDFAVSGAVLHGPPGSNKRAVTGIFSDERAPFEHFFPPSSFSHRRDVTDRVGLWLSPKETRAPVDADFLLRAAHAGMKFASTQRITVHKFAAAHRYLSYLCLTSDEQEEMLRRTSEPGYQEFVAAELAAARADGSFMTTKQRSFRSKAKGKIAAANARTKGTILPALQRLERREVIKQDRLRRAFDWQRPKLWRKRTRWVGLNPKPRVLIPFAHRGKVMIELYLAHDQSEALDRLSLSVNGLPHLARMSAPRRQGSVWEATATLECELRETDFTVLELDLTPSQRPLEGRRGIGMAEIVVQPLASRE